MKNILNRLSFEWLVFSLSFVFFIWGFYIYIFNPLFMKKLPQAFQKQTHYIAQVIEGDLLASKLRIKVLKRVTDTGVDLEFLSWDSGSYRLINKVRLPGRYDGHFEYEDGALSLGLMDENGDGFLEIVAPTFNRFLIPSLNIVVYNKNTNRFELKNLYQQ